MTLFRRNRPDNANRVGWLFLIAGLLALGTAYVAEHKYGFVPCVLCLWERWPWRVLSGIGVVLLLMPRRYAPPVAYLGLACVTVSIGLAIMHSGVEHHFWPSPDAECRVPVFHGGDFKTWIANLPKRPSKPCDSPDYLLGLPISMTELGGVYACVVWVLGFMGTSRLLRQLR
ncbi:disulfide bond formation protein B [Neokomagataea tanensis]|uniref:Disulfide bond formation protein B n=1 Tax=Neokomagataea tanensis TaxID=661191 RepID=A0A4Y6V3M6_9PROT|nr:MULTISPECIES: disulfide bond formation protein B [Neokomagataea]QDH24543.1 disulfide bond formation protein B [Neokomagataea tanensis]